MAILGDTSITSLKVLNNFANVAYGTCDTAAATATKIVTINDANWTLRVGNIVAIKFTNSNTASNVTLNVNNTGAKPLWVGNTVYTSTSSSYCGNAGYIIYYIYDGTNWCWMHSGWNMNSDTYPASYCSTGASTAAKACTHTQYKATAKSYTLVTMRYTNTAASALTLNINSQGAKPIYINGTASSTTNYTLPEGTYLVYYDGTNYYFRTDGKITGDITGSATKATQDGSGNNIVNTYATKTELGNKQDKITSTNKLDYSLLSGTPTIPSAVTESTVSGWGFTKNTGTYSKPSDGIPKTDLASAVQTSLGKADTALQSYTETDPVFSASAAAGIKSSDITNWNNKTSNTGTITGITMNGASKGTSGVVDLGTVITSHQDISGKQDKLTTQTAYTTKGSATKVPQITTNSLGQVTAITEVTITDNDTKNTAGSTDTSSKIFLVGATSQAANPQTYSDNEVFATNGVLSAKEFQVNTKVNLVYDSMYEGLKVIFN